MPEDLDQHAVAQAAIAYDQRFLAEPRHDRHDDQCSGEDDLGALGLQANDRPALVGRPARVERDLPLDLGDVEDGSWTTSGSRLEPVCDGGEVGHRATHADQHVRRRPAVERRELGSDGLEGALEAFLRDDLGKAVRLREAHGTHVDTEPLVDVVALAEGELRAPSAGVEDRERASDEPERRLRREVGQPACSSPD